MGTVLGELLPLSMAIALNPIPIIALMLTFQSSNARSLSAMFAMGWVSGIVSSMIVTTLLSSLLPERDPDESAPIAGAIMLVLGLVLIVLAIRLWRQRPGDNEEAALPEWMASTTTMDASRGLKIGFLISGLNFKHLLIASSAGVIIGAAELSTLSRVVAFVLFILFASSSVILPVLAHRAMGQQFGVRTQGLYHWLVTHNATILAVLLIVIGTVIIGDGIAYF
jgi:hypothetical protein